MELREQILKDVVSLKPLSQSAIILTTIIHNPDYKAQEIVRVVEHDPVLTASVLRIANSAAFGRKYPVEDVKQAVPLLGERMVVGIAFGVSAGEIFEDPLDGYEASAGALWKHSLLTAIASKEVAKYAKVEVREGAAFTGGLLHDLGKAVMSNYLKGHAKESVLAVENGSVEDYIAAEDAMVGTNHATVGSELGRIWRLPAPLTEVIAHHHRPAEASEEYRSLVYIAHVGDFIAMMLGDGGSDTFLYRLDLKYLDYITLSKKMLERVLLNTQVELEKTLEALYGGEKEETP